MLRSLAVVTAFLGSLIVSAAAQDVRRSECLAVANAPPRATPVGLRRVAAKTDEVAITYAGHATYYIDTPGGMRIATDYNGAYRTGRLPDIVTMNLAHGTHYTLFPIRKSRTSSTDGARTGNPRTSPSASATSTSAMSRPTSAAIGAKVPTVR